MNASSASNANGARAGSSLWAVAGYFNPMAYERRLGNYRFFRRRLRAPLLTVELSYQEQFALGESDADILIQLRGRDVLWQKERLLNLALEALPASCDRVAWLDCDVFFEDEQWAPRASRLLERFSLVQLFREVHYLRRDWKAEGGAAAQTERTRLSLASGVASGLTPEAALKVQPPGAPVPVYANGLAWAARREVLERHGFYDARILGGGDRALVCAAYGCFDPMIERHVLNGPQVEHYLAWAEPFHESVRGRVSFLDGSIHHVWHGDVLHRGLTSRQPLLRDHDFDPYADIALADNGCWRWNSRKPAFHERVRAYFAARREDG